MIQHIDMNFPSFEKTVGTPMNAQLKSTPIKIANRFGSTTTKHGYFNTWFIKL